MHPDVVMAQKTSTVNISFREELLDEIDDVARAESRSRSELIREAARMYIERRRRWNAIFAQAEQMAAAVGATKDDVRTELRKHRRGK
jgi:metal-responsive CopG/Arc/MetJ family transcriptional regulator